MGAIDDLIQKIAVVQPPYQIQFYVLCGKNRKLYEKLKEMQNSHIIPFPYSDCREKMNELYDQMDAIITKLGGVTISECLFKRKPIFIFNALPGQEKNEPAVVKGFRLGLSPKQAGNSRADSFYSPRPKRTETISLIVMLSFNLLTNLVALIFTC